jgi:hypothetical protein
MASPGTILEFVCRVVGSGSVHLLVFVGFEVHGMASRTGQLVSRRRPDYRFAIPCMTRAAVGSASMIAGVINAAVPEGVGTPAVRRVAEFALLEGAEVR